MIQEWYHYTQTDLVNALQDAGITKNDTVFSHIDMRNLGIPKELHDGKSSVEVILDAMRKAVGSDGTFLTPTYSYSLCWNENFDPDKTPSAVGAFGNKFRKMRGVKRSCDPIFSVAGIGSKVEDLFLSLPYNCFGKDCIYERLLDLNAMVCNIGLGFNFITPIHYFEQCIGVPYRFLKLFSGYVHRNGQLRKERWLYNVRIFDDYSQPAAHRLWDDAKAKNLCKVVSVGLSQISTMRFQDVYSICRENFKDNSWYLAEGPACDLIRQEKIRVGIKDYNIDLHENSSVEEMINALWLLPRDIVSDGYDVALKALAGQVPMTIHEYPTGAECFTWVIPEKWTCKQASLTTCTNEKIFAYSDNPLHVVSYSLPFEGEVSRDELFKHLHVHSKLPDAVPFVFKYYERDWGLCCSQKLKDSLTDKTYRVKIKTDFSYSKLKVGEVVIPGESEECFVLCAHLCHPGMINDGLSGVVSGVNIMRQLLKRNKLRYTYRCIFLPETIGSAAYLSHNQELIPKMIGGLFLEMLATNHPHLLKLSFNRDSQIDKCVSSVVREHDTKSRIVDLFAGVLNDERMFNAPGINVPMLSLSRALEGGEMYKEYHSNFDNLDIVNFKNLNDSCNLVLKIIDAVEQNRCPKTKFRGEIFCSRYNGIDYDTMGDCIRKITFYIDGNRTVADIADKVGMGFMETRKALGILEKEGLLEWA